VIGTATGTLKFSSNSTTGSTSTVNLSGVGTTAQHQVSLSWAAPANSPVPVVDYNVYRATGTSSSYQLLNSASTTSYVDLSVSANTTYSYYVTSMGNTGAESIPSNHVTVTVP
jgi:fibronectin type 3 domain-containing protein